MKEMKGIFPALITPMNKDYSINFGNFKKLIDFCLDSGIDGFYIGGSTGEGMLMTSEERKQVFREVKKCVGDAVPMIAHVGTVSTDEAIGMALEAKKLGYDAISAVAPFYYGFSVDAIKQYYTDIVSAADMPMYIYNFKAGTGFGLTPQTAKEIFDSDPRFVGVKHTSNDLFALEQFKATIENITVFNGYDEICLGGLSMGADGAIGSTYNFMGKKFVKLYYAFKSGDMITASKLQKEANEIISVMCKYGVLQCEKEILTQMGIDVGPCRRPFLPVDDEAKRAVSKLIDLI